jgi:outer membrane protein assembly factor BamB
MIPVSQKEVLNAIRAKKTLSKIRWVRLLALLLLLAASLTALIATIHKQRPVVAAAGDWPTYLHDLQRTGASGDTIISPANAGQLTLHWAFKTGGVIAASPTVVGGTVYVGSWDGYEYALDATTGALKWKTYLGLTQAPTCDPPSLGISSAAAVLNGVVYVGGGDSYWYALDATSGAILWKVFTGDNSAASGHYNWSSPLLYNGYAYIGVASLGDCPLVQGQLLQVSLSTHQVVNTFNAVTAGQTGGGIWTSPSVDTTTNTVYVDTGTQSTPFQPYSQAVIALDASTLAVKGSWKLPESAVANNSDFSGTPTLFSDAAGHPLVAALNNNGYVYVFNRTNISAGPIWQQQIVVDGSGYGTVSSGVFANGLYYQAGGNTSINGHGYKGAVRALDPATGNSIWEHGASDVVTPALAYSNGLVIDGAGSLFEVLDAKSGTRLYSYETSNKMYAAPSVSNGQIFTGNTDGYVHAFSLPATPPPPPPPDPNCPSGWTCQDIGNPTPAGSETVSSSTWSVKAGGAGIGGNSDQFRFIAQSVSGDTQITAQVASQQSTSGSAQAALMVRQSIDPGSPYYAVSLTNSNSLVVQYRSAFGGTVSVPTSLNAVSPPLYLEIQRVGDQFQAATSHDGVTYTLVPGATANVPMPASVMEGVALSSGTQGTLNTATYKSVSIGSPTTPPNPQPPATPCPAGWSCADIGDSSVVGDQSLSSGTWTLKGTGIDISGYSDQFHYVWQQLSADGTISARVLSQTNTGGWARAGIMMRQSTDAGSAYYAAFVTPANGIVVQYRPAQGLVTTILTQNAGTVPVYLEIARSGNNFSAYTSSDGVNWAYVISSTIALSLSSSILVGLGASAYSGGAVSTVTFDTVNIGTSAPAPPTGCPSGWTCEDIGGYHPAGSQSFSGNIWGVKAAGYDIWDVGDQFRYLWQQLAADGTISARILSQQNTEGWAKAGVMLRQTTDPGSPYYGAFMTPSNGVTVQYRAAQGNATVQLTLFAATAPLYFMVGRSGNTYSTYTSTDGVTWTIVGGSTVTLNMTGPLMAGLAVTSHDVGIPGTTTFDTVRINTSLPPPPGCPSGWSCADVGNPALAGNQNLNGGTWTIQGAGGDIWGTADQFHFVWQQLAADGSVSAHVVSQQNTDGWAKAGVMLRQSTDPGSAYYSAFVTPSNGINVQYRAAQGAASAQLVALAGTAPAYLRVARSGTTYTTYTSSDGTTWTAVAGSGITLNLNGPISAGLAVTSHNPAALCTVTFDIVSVQ